MEKRDSVDQRNKLEQFVAEHHEELRRQGAVVASYRQRGQRRTGPYYRLTCRDAQGWQRSLYLGCESDLVQAARQQLQALQRPRTLSLVLGRARRAVRREARRQRAADGPSLAAFGVTYKGRELRGPLKTVLQTFAERQAAMTAHDGAASADLVEGTSHDPA